MSFVGRPFAHDVFITYSHGDVDGDGHSILKQWSEGFAKELERELKAMPDLGADIRIFRDQHLRPGQGLDPMEPLTEKLQDDVAGSAILAILMTPQYLNSAWCGDERTWWLQAQSDLALTAEGRLAVARIWPTDNTDWPDELVDSRGHRLVGRCFYDEARAESRPQPFEWPEPDENSKNPFRDALLDYVGDLRLHLKKLREILQEKERQQAEADRLSADSGQAIYLHGRKEHSDIWEKVWSDLDAAGYQVFPSEPDPVSADPIETRRISDDRIGILRGCDALLLLGTENTRTLDADLVVVGRNERHKARAYSNRLLPCAVVDTAGLADSKHRILTNAQRLGIHWIKAEHNPWTPSIHPWLDGARL